MEAQNSDHSTGSHHVRLNVGGKLFETTASTLLAGGQDSLLAAISTRAAAADDPVFVDRDPEVFAALLSLLRSGRLPSAARRRFSPQDLADEALYYGIESRLHSALSPPPLLGFDAGIVTTLQPASDALPTALSASGPGDGSVWVAHGGQISAYDWTLAHIGTVRTHVDEITAVRHASREVAAIGSPDSAGLHFYDVSGGRHIGSLRWFDPADLRVQKARVTAIGGGEEGGPIFAAFECQHRENCILEVDRATLRAAAEIGRQNGSAAKVAAAGKLVYLAERGLVFAAAVRAGAFGCAGYMRLWDPRAGQAAWETSEPGATAAAGRFGDAFADADVDREAGAIYKVCWRSGDVAVADLRKLGDDPWVYLEGQRGSLRKAGGGQGSVVHCYKGQVFVSKEEGLEVWTPMPTAAQEGEEAAAAAAAAVYGRNFVDREEDARRGIIQRMEGGGDRLFVCREGVEGVEVWETSHLSGAVSLSLL